jgi:import inner membrane translocase subunit TIM44
MIGSTRLRPLALTRAATFACSSKSYGRTAAYRRLLNQSTRSLEPRTSQAYSLRTSPSLQTRPPTSLTPLSSSWPAFSSSRQFHSSALRFQQPRPAEEVRDPPREETQAEPKEAGSQSAEEPAAKESADQTKEQPNEDGEQEGGKKKEEKKEDAPPPPHGDKTPWQVFTETLRTEFKASKEWNESTKALASSAHQFSESESVKRARAAYSAASGAATSTTSSALKSTGKVIGQSAAWTWDTPVVKGVRATVNATGRGIEKATRPVRETTVYKTAVGGVKDVIDDGSSSRYGGWVEKEERRKAREVREAKEGRMGKRVEKMEEDPK